MAKILIVDDEPRIRELIHEHLQYSGYICEEAGDGSAALAQLSGGGFDLVILDLMMPFMDGMTCLREMRARHINTPVIILTARGEEYDKLAGLESGADDYVVKPFSPRELVARVRAVLNRTMPRQLEVSSVPFACRRLAYADESASVIHESAYRRLQSFVQPFFSARIRRIRVSRVYDDVYILRHSVFHFVKRQKFDIHRQSAYRLQYSLIRIDLLIPKFVRHHMAHPTSLLSPGVQKPHFQPAPRFFVIHRRVYRPEFVRHFRHTVYKRRKFRRQRKIPAESHAVYRFPHDCAPCRPPVAVQFFHRVFFVPLKKRIGKEIRQKSPFMVFYVRNFR